VTKADRLSVVSEKNLTILIVFVTLLWGISWVSAKYLSVHMPLMELTFWRFVTTAIFAYSSLLFFGQSSLSMPRASWIWLLGGGIFMGLSQIVNFAGLSVGYAGLASIIFNATSPIFSFVLAFLFLSHKITKLEVFALILGTFGAMVIFHFWTLSLERVFSSGNFYFLLNALGFAMVTLCSQKASEHALASSFTVYMSIIGAILILPFCNIPALGELFTKDSIFWANLIFMAGVAGGFGTTAYFFAVGRLGSAKTSSFIFLVPLGSILASSVAFGESVEMLSIVGCAISLIAVYILNRKKNLH
jgi:drug/metabolite transporter (DMT)-like permease